MHRGLPLVTSIESVDFDSSESTFGTSVNSAMLACASEKFLSGSWINSYVPSAHDVVSIGGLEGVDCGPKGARRRRIGSGGGEARRQGHSGGQGQEKSGWWAALELGGAIGVFGRGRVGARQRIDGGAELTGVGGGRRRCCAEKKYGQGFLLPRE